MTHRGSVTKGRVFFYEREFERVVRELNLPAATNKHALTRCPVHKTPIPPVTRICPGCRTEAWAEVGRRYHAAGRPAQPPAAPLPPLHGRKETRMNSSSTDAGALDLIEASAVESAGPLTLFGTSDPRTALARMADLAGVLVDVIKDRRLATRISGKDYLHAEAWTTLGGMLGVVPIVIWTRPNETDDGYVARVEARTLDGRVVGAAEAECSRVESKWKSAYPHALRGMAQTRAVSRALRAPLGQIVVLAGYEPAVAEEMDGAVDVEPAAAAPPAPAPRRPTQMQAARLSILIDDLNRADPDTDWASECRRIAGVERSEDLTEDRALHLIDQLTARLTAIVTAAPEPDPPEGSDA